MFGVARRMLADAERSATRRRRLGQRLATEAVVSGQANRGPDHHDPAAERALAALATLRPADREALQLVLWDALNHAEAAAVVGCSANAFEIRYRRARAAVRDQLAQHANAVTSDFPVRNAAPVRGDVS